MRYFLNPALINAELFSQVGSWATGVEILSMDGKVVAIGSPNGSIIHINFERLTDGVYVVRIAQDSLRVVQRFVQQ